MPVDALTLLLDDIPDPLPIEPITRPFDVTIRPPGSKSITNRALLLAALAEGTSTLRAPLIDADDAQVMIRALGQLGARIEIKRAPSASSGGNQELDELRVTGVNGRWKIAPGQTVTLNLNNAGTATRFLTAAAMLAPPESDGIVIDGDERMRMRPIAELTRALAELGVRAEHTGRPGCPPVHIFPVQDIGALSDRVEFGRTASSQFISAMLMACAFLDRDVGIILDAPPTSEPYVTMTRSVMEAVGIPFLSSTAARTADLPGIRTRLPGQRLKAFTYEVEPDASGATYFLAAAALMSSARCVIDGLPWFAPDGSIQGDAAFGGVLAAMGADERADERSTECVGPGGLRPIDYDLSDMPDTAMTVAVLACFASPTPDNPTAKSTLRGLRTLRVKETDRLAALQTELSKIGAKIEIFKDGDDEALRISPPPLSPVPSPLSPVFFDTYHDHRMAMALALIGLRRPNVFIRDPGCVRKTYPGYWADLAKLYS